MKLKHKTNTSLNRLKRKYVTHICNRTIRNTTPYFQPTI